MDELVQVCLQEVAWQGERGCTLATFWALVDDRLQIEPPTGLTLPLDAALRRYVLRLLDTSVANIRCLRGRESNQIVRLVCDEQTQNALFVTSMIWSQALRATYRGVVMSRTAGRLQSELSAALNLEPKSMFHYIKVLIKNNLVVKIPSAKSNLIVAVQFLDVCPSYHEYVAETTRMEAITSLESYVRATTSERTTAWVPVEVRLRSLNNLLTSATNNTLVFTQIRSALGLEHKKKQFTQLITVLRAGGYVEDVVVAKPLRNEEVTDSEDSYAEEEEEDLDYNDDMEPPPLTPSNNSQKKIRLDSSLLQKAKSTTGKMGVDTSSPQKSVKNAPKRRRKSGTAKPRRRARIACLRLLKPIPPNLRIGQIGQTAKSMMRFETEEEEEEDEIDLRGDLAGLDGTCLDLPMETIIYRTIVSRGEKGIAISEFAGLFPYMGYRVLTKTLDRLEGKVGKKVSKTSISKADVLIRAVLQFEGKRKSTRYVATNTPFVDIHRAEMGLAPVGALSSTPAPRVAGKTLGKVLETASPLEIDVDLNFDIGTDTVLLCKTCKIDLDGSNTEYCSMGCQIKFESKGIGSSMDVLSDIDPVESVTQVLKSDSEMRMGYIMELLDLKEFYMLDQHFVNYFVEYSGSRNNKFRKYYTDKKTILVLCERMGKGKLLKFVKARFENSHGGLTTKHVIARINYDPLRLEDFISNDISSFKYKPQMKLKGPRTLDSFEVDQIKEVKQGLQPMSEVDAVDAAEPTVDTVMDMNFSLHEEPGPSAPPLQIMNAAPISDEFYSKKRKTVEELAADKRSLLIAENYGFKLAKNLRARAFHEWLFEISTPKPETLIKERYVYHLAELKNDLPLSLYFSMVPMRFDSTALKAMLTENPNYLRDTRIGEIQSLQIRELINLADLRTEVFSIAKNLQFLGLIQPMKLDPRGGFKPYVEAPNENQTKNPLPTVFFRIVRNVAVQDYRGPKATELWKVNFSSGNDVELYWNQLRLRCVDVMTSKTKKGVPKFCKGANFLMASRNWSYFLTLTAEMKTDLTANVNYQSKTTPLDNSVEMERLSVLYRIPASKIASFFESVENSWKYSFFNNKLGSKSGLPVKRVGKPARYSAEDDNILCHAFVILSNLGKGNGIKKQMLPQLLPDHPDRPDSNQIRRRVFLLEKTESEKIEILRKIFDHWADESGRRHRLDGAVYDYYDNQLLILTNEFMEFVSQFDEYTLRMEYEFNLFRPPDYEPPFENNTIYLNRGFRAENMQMTHRRPQSIEEGLSIHKAKVSKSQYLDTVIFTIPIDGTAFDFQFTACLSEDVEVHLAATFMKIMCRIPDDVYNPAFAHSYAKQFSCLQRAADLLRSNNSVAHARRVFEEGRQVPGRDLKLTERFIHIVKDSFLSPGLFSESKAYLTEVAANESRRQPTIALPSHQNPGIMAELIEMMAMEQNYRFIPEVVKCRSDLDINISIKSLSGVKVGKPSRNKRQEYVGGEEGTYKRQRNSRASSSRTTDPKASQVVDIISVTTGLGRELLQGIFEAVAKAGVPGLNMFELSVCDSVASSTLQELQLYLDALVQGKMLRRVGFDHPRFISSENLQAWQMKTSPESTVSVENVTAVAPFSPKTWITLEGHVDEKFYEKCCQAVVGAIINKPGIAESTLFRQTSCIVSACELREILDDLVERRIVRRTTVEAERPILSVLDGLFSGDDDEAEATGNFICTYIPLSLWTRT